MSGKPMKRSPIKRSPMKRRPPKTAKVVSEECKEYRAKISEYVCEIESLLRQHPPAAKWMQTQRDAAPWLNSNMQVHHVFGRIGPPELHWFCSVIQISAICHMYNDGARKHEVDVCCLVSKMDRHKRDMEMQEAGIEKRETDPSRLIWNLDAMNKCILGDGGTLAGRIDGVLLPSVRGTVFETWIPELLDYCGRTAS